MNRLTIAMVEVHIPNGETIDAKVFSNKTSAISYAKKATRNGLYIAEVYRWDGLTEIENNCNLQDLAYSEEWEWELTVG